MSQAVTNHGHFFSIVTIVLSLSCFLKHIHLRFKIISRTESLTHSSVAYSCDTQRIFTQVTAVHGRVDSKILLNVFQSVIQYQAGSGDTANTALLSSHETIFT